jgi:mRNA interferase RelE/StbE
VSFRVELTRQARRALASELPEAVAAACYEFIHGPLAENPRRVGKQLAPPHYPRFAARRGDFRIIYKVQDDRLVVLVVNIQHRRDVYRRP